MSVLVVDSIVVPLASADLALRDLQHQRRRWSGKMSSAVHGTALQLRVWAVRTAEMSMANAQTLIDSLIYPQTVSCSGDWINATVTCQAQNDKRGPQAGDGQTYVTFDLQEVI